MIPTGTAPSFFLLASANCEQRQISPRGRATGSPVMDSGEGGGHFTLPSLVFLASTADKCLTNCSCFDFYSILFFFFYMYIYFILFIFRWKVAGVIIGTVSTDIRLNLWKLYILKFVNYKFKDILHPFTSSGLKKKQLQNCPKVRKMFRCIRCSVLIIAHVQNYFYWIKIYFRTCSKNKFFPWSYRINALW